MPYQMYIVSLIYNARGKESEDSSLFSIHSAPDREPLVADRI